MIVTNVNSWPLGIDSLVAKKFSFQVTLTRDGKSLPIVASVFGLHTIVAVLSASEDTGLPVVGSVDAQGSHLWLTSLAETQQPINITVLLLGR